MDEQFKHETEAAIAKALAEQPYIPHADAGLELSRATLLVLSRRFGPEFASEVRQEIAQRAERYAASDDPEDRADAPLIREIVDAPFWKRMGVTSDDA